MAPRVTSSRLERAAECPYSAAGGGIDSTGVAAIQGTGVHAFHVDAYQHGRDTALADMPPDAPHRRLCERLDLESLPWWHGQLPTDAIVLFEASFGYRTETGEVFLLDDRDAYQELDANDHAGTADVVVYVPSKDTVYIWDLKSGDPTQVMRAQDNVQLRSYAFLAAKHFRCSRASIAITHAYFDGSVFTPTAFELDLIDLASFETRVRSIVADVAVAMTATDVRQSLARGPWCKYCPRFVECPAQLAVFRALIGAVHEKQPTEIGPEHVKESRDFLRDAKLWLARLEETVKGYARVESVPTDRPGVVYREVIGSERSVVNHRVALKVIGQRYGEDVARQATVSETSVGAIDDAIKEYAKSKGLKQAATIREAWEVLRKAGAIENVETRSVRETKDAANAA